MSKHAISCLDIGSTACHLLRVHQKFLFLWQEGTSITAAIPDLPSTPVVVALGKFVTGHYHALMHLPVTTGCVLAVFAVSI